MDFKQIQELIKIVNKSNIGELRIEENEFKIIIRQKEEKVQTVFAAAAPQVYAQQNSSQPNQQEQISNAPVSAQLEAAPKVDNFYYNKKAL